MDDVQYRNYTLSDGFGFRMNGKEWEYHSLAELNEEWEDAPEEPKGFWYIDCNGVVMYDNDEDSKFNSGCKQIGNFFESEGEARKAVEKLKALKRLKDKQFKFYGWGKGSLLESKPNTIEFACDDTKFWYWEDIQDDLELLFGGEE